MKIVILFNIFLLLIKIKGLKEDIIDISSHYSPPKPNNNTYFFIPIIGTNDLHGKIFPVRFKKPEKVDEELDYYLHGGAEFIYAYSQILREEWGEDRVLWLDAGDQFQGGKEFVDTNGTIMSTFYNHSKIDAMALGNHEFDFGIDYLKSFIKNSNYPYLVANVYNTTSKKYIYEEWENVRKSMVKTIKVEDDKEIKIGIIGLATVNTPTTTNGSPKEFEYQSYKKIIEEEAKILRENEGVNAVLLLSHLGPVCKGESEQYDKFYINLRNSQSEDTKCDETQEINVLLKSLEKDTIDAIIAGHTHDLVHHWINNVPVIQSTGNQYSNILYLPFIKENDKYKLDKKEIVIEGPLPSCEKVFNNSLRCDYVQKGDLSKGNLTEYSFHNKLIKMDESLKQLFDEERKKIEKELDKTIVESEIFLETIGDKETSLANMVVDIGRRISGADFAFYNLGGYRTSWYPGSINSIDLFLMFPFDNYYVSFDMSGQEVLRMLKSINRYNIYPSSGLMQVFKKSGKQNILVDAKIYDGLYETNIEPYKTYRVCVNDFLFQGGSQFKRVREWYKPKNPLNYDPVRKLVTEYLKEMQIIKEDSFYDKNHPRFRYIE